jgi:hypothetical protein
MSIALTLRTALLLTGLAAPAVVPLAAPAVVPLAAPAVVPLAAPGASLHTASQDSRRQPDTKVVFALRQAPVPTEAPDAEPGPSERLVGMALRDKTIFGVDVYAYGLYLEPYAAQEHLAEFGEASAKQLAKDERLYAALLDSPRIPKSLRLVFVRDVDGEDVVAAFEESLRPRIARARDQLELGDASADLERFRGFFALDQLRDGNELRFSWSAEGVLTTEVAGELRPALHSPALCWALFDVYLGRDPIEEQGRRDLIALLPELLDETLPPRPAAGR